MAEVDNHLMQTQVWKQITTKTGARKVGNAVIEN